MALCSGNDDDDDLHDGGFFCFRVDNDQRGVVEVVVLMESMWIMWITCLCKGRRRLDMSGCGCGVNGVDLEKFSYVGRGRENNTVFVLVVGEEKKGLGVGSRRK